MRANIDDVAKKAGVSISTVSRVLNGKVKVSEKFKESVLAAASELEYNPSQAARTLALKKSNLIGIIIPDVSNSFYSKMLSAIEDEASLHGYRIILCCIQENIEKEIKYVRLLKQMYVDGLLLMHEKGNDKSKEVLNNCDFPIVQASVFIEGLNNSVSLNVNDHKASYEAVKYLIDRGHRKIAMITGDMVDRTSGQLRYEGYLEALSDNDIILNPDFVKQGNYTYDIGYECMKELLSRKVIPSAVFAACDEMAIGAESAAMDLGYLVPQDISVVGFDNIELSKMVRPSLTTVAQSANLIGRLAIKSIINSNGSKKNYLKIDDKVFTINNNRVDTPYKLIERNSVTTI